jgi:hypothetical protein
MLRVWAPLVDLVALGLLALVFLFPRPGVTVRPALARAGTQTLDRIAELEARMASAPDDAALALELADLYVGQWRPDWALATVGPLAARAPGDYRLHLAMTVAHAERFDFIAAKAALDRAKAACGKNAGPAPCGEPERVRMSVFDRAIGDVVAEHVNPANDPNRAKEIIDSAMHNMKIPRPEDAAKYRPAPRKPPPRPSEKK